MFIDPLQDDVRGYRMAIASRSAQAAAVPKVPSVFVDWSLSTTNGPKPSKVIMRKLVFHWSVDRGPCLERLCFSSARYISVQEEIAYGPACWLWDYLRRSGSGFPRFFFTTPVAESVPKG